jgi:hypothetical protein
VAGSRLVFFDILSGSRPLDVLSVVSLTCGERKRAGSGCAITRGHTAGYQLAPHSSLVSSPDFRLTDRFSRTVQGFLLTATPIACMIFVETTERRKDLWQRLILAVMQYVPLLREPLNAIMPFHELSAISALLVFDN